MINGMTHNDLILKVLFDGRPHFVREFLDAGLCHYSRRISDLREQGHVIRSIKIGKRPGYQLIARTNYHEEQKAKPKLTHADKLKFAKRIEIPMTVKEKDLFG